MCIIAFVILIITIDRRSLIYVILTLAVGTCFACIALYLACPWDASAWDDSVPGKVPACLIDAWLGQIRKTVVAIEN